MFVSMFGFPEHIFDDGDPESTELKINSNERSDSGGAHNIDTAHLSSLKKMAKTAQSPDGRTSTLFWGARKVTFNSMLIEKEIHGRDIYTVS